MRKIWFLFLIPITIATSCRLKSAHENLNTASIGNQDSVLTIVNWNIEWFGSTQNGPLDKQLQYDNALKILRYLNADLFGLCEMVDVSTLQKLVRDLGKDYDYVISDYASGVRSSQDRNYGTAQKEAFVYRKSVFSNINTTAYLKTSSAAGYQFSNGRYPFLFIATATKSGISIPINVLLIHAKSGADNTSYQRRAAAANELKKSLDKDFKGQSLLLIGDFNDGLDKSITHGKPSPYKNFLTDNNYEPLSLSLTKDNERSTLDFPSIIDQQIASISLYKYYQSGSIKIRSDILKVVSDFTNGQTSDHYPMSSSYNFNQFKSPSSVQINTPPTNPDTSTELKKDSPSSSGIFSINIQESNIEIKADIAVQNIQFVLYDGSDKKLVSVHKNHLEKQEDFFLRIPELANGDYTLVIFSSKGKQVINWKK